MDTYKNPMGADDSPSSGLTRSYTRSSKHELLKQIRDAVNPNQRWHNRILIAQAALVTTAVVLLVIFAILAQIEILALNEAAEDEIIPNLDSIIGSLKGIEQGVNASYEATLYMPLLLDMNRMSKELEGNLSITVQAMTNSPILSGAMPFG